MVGFSQKEGVACERCGAFIPRTLTKFHRCNGSDKSKRPANISLERWQAAQLQQLQVTNIFDFFRQEKSRQYKTSTSAEESRVKTQEKQISSKIWNNSGLFILIIVSCLSMLGFCVYIGYHITKR